MSSDDAWLVWHELWKMLYVMSVSVSYNKKSLSNLRANTLPGEGVRYKKGVEHATNGWHAASKGVNRRSVREEHHEHPDWLWTQEK